MVFTRSSARKPPNPSRPSSAPSRLTSQPEPIPVNDDPPPPNPRRSRRIKLKNAENTSSQPPSPDPTITTPVIELPEHDNQTLPASLAESQTDHQQQPPQQDNEPFAATLPDDPFVTTPTPKENETIHHSDDEAPEEIKTLTVLPRTDPSHHHTPQHTIKKNRRRRQRHRQRRKKEDSTLLPASLPSQHDLPHQIVAPIEESSPPASVRLPADAIAAAQQALEDAEKRRQNANQIARLENQVNHVGGLNRSQQIGRMKVALASDTYQLSHRSTKKGRKSASSFLASCIRNGPKRVPGSKIAIIARSKSFSQTY